MHLSVLMFVIHDHATLVMYVFAAAGVSLFAYRHGVDQNMSSPNHICEWSDEGGYHGLADPGFSQAYQHLTTSAHGWATLESLAQVAYVQEKGHTE